MGYDGVSMNTQVMAGYQPPPGLSQLKGMATLQCAMAEMVALATVAQEMGTQLQTFAQDSNVGMVAYKNQVDGTVKDYYDTDANGGLHFDGIVPERS